MSKIVKAKPMMPALPALNVYQFNARSVGKYSVQRRVHHPLAGKSSTGGILPKCRNCTRIAQSQRRQTSEMAAGMMEAITFGSRLREHWRRYDHNRKVLRQYVSSARTGK